jgi:hypothetical protein
MMKLSWWKGHVGSRGVRKGSAYDVCRIIRITYSTGKVKV